VSPDHTTTSADGQQPAPSLTAPRNQADITEGELLSHHAALSPADRSLRGFGDPPWKDAALPHQGRERAALVFNQKFKQ